MMINSLVLSSSVLPSGAARDAASAPTAVPAPGRFSTTTVGPPVRPTCSATTRARKSAAPPAANGTMILMVGVWDQALRPAWPIGIEMTASAVATAARRSNFGCRRFMAWPVATLLFPTGNHRRPAVHAVRFVRVTHDIHLMKVALKLFDHEFHLRCDQVNMRLASAWLREAPDHGVDGDLAGRVLDQIWQIAA